VQTFLYFLLVLGVLIFVHELGHFLVARWYGVRVLTFSLGFGPKILKLNRGGTEYCISLIPLGGYVKMAGETVADERDGAPDEFLSKSKWIRFQVYLAGPAMNVLLAVVVMIGVLSRGANVPEYLTQPPVVGVVQPDSPAERVGIAVGDRILAVNGREMPTWDALSLAVLPKAGQELTINIDRAG
jgi:regulator of sigma E protease